jgi:hypothetical protein
MHNLTERESECLDSGRIKAAGWDRTSTDEEHRLLKTVKGCSGAMCACVWLLQRQYRLTHGKLGAEIVTDPDFHEPLWLVRAQASLQIGCIPKTIGSFPGT